MIAHPSSGLLTTMFSDPTSAEGTNIDAAPKRRITHRTPREVRTGEGEGDDNQGVCHVEGFAFRGSVCSMRTSAIQCKLNDSQLRGNLCA
jgi:hypothetical protein